MTFGISHVPMRFSGTAKPWPLQMTITAFDHYPAEKLMDKPWYSHGTTMVKPCFVTMSELILDLLWSLMKHGLTRYVNWKPCQFRPRPWSSSTLKWLQYDTVKINLFEYEMAMVNLVHIIPIKSWSDQILIRMVWYWNGNDVTVQPCSIHGQITVMSNDHAWNMVWPWYCGNDLAMMMNWNDHKMTVLNGSFNLLDWFLAYYKSDWSFWESSISSWRHIRKTRNVNPL